MTGVNTVGPTTGSTPTWFGVSRQDAKAYERVVVFRGGVQKLIASTPVTAGDRVVPAAAGQVAASTGANAVGTALSGGIIGATVLVALDR